MKCSDFVFDWFHLLSYKCLKIYFKRSGSYIGSPDWMQNKKATIKPITKNDNKYFQKDEWKKFEKNIKITRNVLFTKNEKKYSAYVSKNNANREKQVILLMISNGER